MYEDPIVEEVRKTRERLAREHDFNVASIFQDLRKRQASLGRRLVQRQRKKLGEQITAPDQDSAPLHPRR